ncbi:unnamed protein product [Polarella glacialis]|uniref:Uncharacterized protein n=2 Tax=Polarella glacialis TaxID=89957 RepID=A0A813H4W9_POLGL|nr:unnamed protein product [Polarella glacialis]
MRRGLPVVGGLSLSSCAMATQIHGSMSTSLAMEVPGKMWGLIANLAGPLAQRRFARCAAWAWHEDALSWPPAEAFTKDWAIPDELRVTAWKEVKMLWSCVQHCREHDARLELVPHMLQKLESLLPVCQDFDLCSELSAELAAEMLNSLLEDASRADSSVTETFCIVLGSSGQIMLPWMHQHSYTYVQPQLNAAAAFGRASLCRLLLELTADLEVEADSPRILKNDGRFCGKRTTPLCAACALGQVATVKALLDCKAYPGTVLEMTEDAVRYEGHTALTIACKLGHVDVVRLLLERNAALDVDQVCVEDDSDRDMHRNDESFSIEYRERTALLLACEAGHAEVVELLLASGAWADFECSEICNRRCKITGPMPQQSWRSPLGEAAKLARSSASNLCIKGKGKGKGRGQLAAYWAGVGEKIHELLQQSLALTSRHAGCGCCGRLRRHGWHSSQQWNNGWFCNECWESWFNEGARYVKIASGHGGGLELKICGDTVTLRQDYGMGPHDDELFEDGWT